MADQVWMQPVADLLDKKRGGDWLQT
jgi:hypothetical protein